MQDHRPATVDLCQVVQGARVPLDPSSAKMAALLLPPGSECDAEISTHTFRVRWRLRPSRDYNVGLGPAVASYLLGARSEPVGAEPLLLQRSACEPRFHRLARERLVQPSARELGFQPSELLEELPTESLAVWLRAEQEVLEVRVRCTPTQSWPDALPAPVELASQFIDLRQAHRCPHCGTSSTRYRVLHDGGRWVCPSCARSLSPGPDV